MNRGYEVEDLYQIGCIGFIKSIKRFDTNFEVKLSTYSVPYILGEIKRFIRDDGPIKVSRSIKELNVKIQELKKHYLITKGREITIEEIAKELGVYDQVKQDGGSWASVPSRDCGNIVTKAIEIANRSVENKQEKWIFKSTFPIY